MTKSTITIKTHLSDGIYASCGGGAVRTHYTYKAGPRDVWDFRTMKTKTQKAKELIASTL